MILVIFSSRNAGIRWSLSPLPHWVGVCMAKTITVNSYVKQPEQRAGSSPGLCLPGNYGSTAAAHVEPCTRGESRASGCRIVNSLFQAAELQQLGWNATALSCSTDASTGCIHPHENHPHATPILLAVKTSQKGTDQPSS